MLPPSNSTSSVESNIAQNADTVSANIVVEDNVVEDTAVADSQLLLGLDYGVKKMGMALGNTITQNARAFDILAMNNGQPDWDNLLGIIKSWGVNQVIVGLPLNMDGTSSMLSRRAHKFARRLAHRLVEQHLSAVVSMCDERLTSMEARDIAWEQGWITDARDPIDDISACLLLASYFADPSSARAIATIKVEN